MSEKLRIITRSSVLAVWQAKHVAAQLAANGIETELIPIETKGDKVLNTSIAKIGSKGVFTQELENALLEGRADLAVHSAKDMPSELPEGLELIAFGKREKPTDVLVSHHQGLDLERGFKVGTSSTRRVGLMNHYYPTCQTVPMRGNLQTRFKKMENGDCEALLLAYAGVKRLGLEQYIIHEFDWNEFTPQAGQGSITVEISSSLSDEKKAIIQKSCNDSEAWHTVGCERAFLKKVKGGCSIPLFAYARVENNQLSFSAGIVGLDGKELVREEANGDVKDYLSIGEKTATAFLAKGGEQLLQGIKEQLSV